MEDTATREQRLRRAARRQGMRLEKSRARDPRALSFGTYWLTNASLGTVVAGDEVNGYGLSLDEIERTLMAPRTVVLR